MPAHPMQSPVSMDVSLEWLISATGLQLCSIAGRRLNAAENVIAGLARRWRSDMTPIRPADELRMSHETSRRLTAWVCQHTEATDDPKTVARLTTYASGALTDENVPDGWIRLISLSSE